VSTGLVPSTAWRHHTEMDQPPERSSTRSLDRLDRKILTLLQQDCTLPIAELARRVGLSQTPCWKRVQRLEATGVIERRVALLSPERVGMGLSVFVAVEASDHSPEWLARFAAAVSAMPEVMQAHRMAGDVDYMLHVVVADMAEYDRFYKRLIGAVALKNVSSRFSMERIKSTTALPLGLEAPA
jgi:Lrp/AsnC family transcriptional regulator